jgi:hypothetical protein
MPTVIECPRCGYRFNKPFFSQRRFGVGLSFSAIGGVLTCPKCKYSTGVRDFKKVTGPPSPEVRPGDQGQAEEAPKADGDAEPKGDSVDDSKYV